MAKYYNIHISIYSLFLAKIGYIKVVVKPKKAYRHNIQNILKDIEESSQFIYN